MSQKLLKNLRYLQTNTLKEEQAILANYCQEIIRAYGIDVKYIRRSESYATSGCVSDLVYGHQETASYNLSSSMITYMSVENSVLALNNMGITPVDEVDFYFSLGDFAARFSNDLGAYAEYPITPTSGFVRPSSGKITGNFASEIANGTYELPISGDSAWDIVIPEDLIELTSEPVYNKAVNPYTAKTFFNTVSGGYIHIQPIISYEKNPLRGGLYEYHLSGSVLYSGLIPNSKYETFIKPNVGDLIELDYAFTEQETTQRDIFEITEVVSRKPTDSEGINPLMGKYMWKCKALRTTPSHETGINNVETSVFINDDILTKEQKDSADMFNAEIFDFDSSNLDNVYGGYNTRSDLLSGEPDSFETSGDLNIGYLEIFDFKTGGSLLTDGSDLYFSSLSGVSKITHNTSGDYTEGLYVEVPNVLYLKETNSNLYFCSSILKDSSGKFISNKLTSYSVTTKTSTNSTSFDKLITDYNKNLNKNSSFYKIKSNKLALFSDGNNLFCINQFGIVEQLN